MAIVDLLAVRSSQLITQQSNTRWRCCSMAITLNGRGYRSRRLRRIYILWCG